ncbi:AlpA family transcriptional regulator [Pseudomonas guariconensis]|uniref:helix-turn-helix transcriptional regulator n=1 Tax=Pseudomonas guariconensis TaxID=1288410 RepID=UPI0018AB6899|nr:AlpA family transcriptional regulator [Pseudomonas guariconensis]MBF8733062.1 AlpA family transcriptional regulator [Pseudomonas guariconensis]
MNAAQIPDDVEFIKIAEVRKMTGLSTSTIYERMMAGSFPRQVKLGPRAVAWVKSDVQAWIKGRIGSARPS